MNQTDERSVFERVACEHIQTRLAQVDTMLQEGLGGNIRQVRDLLAEAADQADTVEMLRRTVADASVLQTATASTTHDAAGAGTVHTLRGRDLGEPVAEFLLIPFGKVEVERPLAGGDFQFREEHAVAAVNWFANLGRKLAIDYEHQSFERHNTRPDGLRPAAGWIAGLEMRGDGLWAVGVTWTERAKELLRTGEYRYFSPVIFWANESASRLVGLGPVALTNDPAMRGIQALAASRRAAEGSVDASESRDSDVIAAVATEVDGESEEFASLLARAEAAEGEVDLLKRQILARDADQFIERGLREGRIVDATSMDWRDEYLRDSNAAEQRLARSPVLRAPGRLIPGASAMRVGERSRVDATALREIGAEPEDLKAFEAAATAGRVRTAR